MKKFFLLIIFTCTVFVLNVQANDEHNKFIVQIKKLLHDVNVKDSIPKDTTDAKPVFNTSNIDPKTYIGDPFFNIEGGRLSSNGLQVEWNYQGSRAPTITFPNAPEDARGGNDLGYSLNEDKTTGRKVGAYVLRTDGSVLLFSRNANETVITTLGKIGKGVTIQDLVPKGLFNGSPMYKQFYESTTATKTTPNPNFNNAPAGTPSTTDVLGTATIVDSSVAGIFIKITRPNNITLVNVIKLDKYPNANVYLSTKLVKMGNLPESYILYNIGQNGNYTPSPVPPSMVAAYAKYSSTPWNNTTNQKQ